MSKERFRQLIEQKHSAPFLFIGSGFTKHYLNTPTWASILQKFSSKHINSYYSSSETSELPVIARLIAKDVNTAFWSLPDNETEKKELQEKVRTGSSVLK